MTTSEATAIRVRLTVPVARLGVGALSFDPLADLLGVSLREVLESLLEAEPSRRTSASGPAVEVFPLALPDGEGASVPLGPLGELGFANDGGMLMLTLPLPLASWVQGRMATTVVRGPVRRRSTDGTATVVHLWLALRSGARAAIPRGVLGELGIEAT